MELTGGLFDIIVAFASGLAVSFTPCIYPVMPLTASYIAGANSDGTRGRAFIISLVYVLGMALVYAGLALFAGLTGKIFGQFQNSPPFYFVTGILLAVFSLIMFDVIAMPTLGSVGGVRKAKPNSLWAVLLFGMTSGLVVGPCTAPVLGSLLVYIGAKQSLWYGAFLMFIFAYGMGFSLILVGTFSGFLSRLPKSGGWLSTVKKISGIILLIIAAYFIYKGFKAIH